MEIKKLVQVEISEVLERLTLLTAVWLVVTRLQVMKSEASVKAECGG